MNFGSLGRCFCIISGVFTYSRTSSIKTQEKANFMKTTDRFTKKSNHVILQIAHYLRGDVDSGIFFF